MYIRHARRMTTSRWQMRHPLLLQLEVASDALRALCSLQKLMGQSCERQRRLPQPGRGHCSTTAAQQRKSQRQGQRPRAAPRHGCACTERGNVFVQSLASAWACSELVYDDHVTTPGHKTLKAYVTTIKPRLAPPIQHSVRPNFAHRAQLCCSEAVVLRSTRARDRPQLGRLGTWCMPEKPVQSGCPSAASRQAQAQPQWRLHGKAQPRPPCKQRARREQLQSRAASPIPEQNVSTARPVHHIMHAVSLAVIMQHP